MQVFTYAGLGFEYSIGISEAQYAGIVKGFKSDIEKGLQSESIIGNYSGPTNSVVVGLSIGEGLGINGGTFLSSSMQDPLIRGVAVFIGGFLGASATAPVDFGAFVLNYSPYRNVGVDYVSADGMVNSNQLMHDILSGRDSPLFWFGGITPQATFATRAYEASKAEHYAFAYQALRFQEIIGW